MNDRDNADYMNLRCRRNTGQQHRTGEKSTREYRLPPIIDKERTGRKIRNLMNSRGYTVQDIKRYLVLGCVQSIYHWFEGTALPSLDNLYALSNLFDVPMDEIVCGSRDVTECRGRPEEQENHCPELARRMFIYNLSVTDGLPVAGYYSS